MRGIFYVGHANAREPIRGIYLVKRQREVILGSLWQSAEADLLPQILPQAYLTAISST